MAKRSRSVAAWAARRGAAGTRPLLAALLALSGCGSSTGIQPVAPGLYAVSEMRAPALGGGEEARRVALAEAAAFCRRQGGTSSPLALRPDGDPLTPYYPTAFDVTFRCVGADAPGSTARPGGSYQRPDATTD